MGCSAFLRHLGDVLDADGKAARQPYKPELLVLGPTEVRSSTPHHYSLCDWGKVSNSLSLTFSHRKERGQEKFLSQDSLGGFKELVQNFP